MKMYTPTRSFGRTVTPINPTPITAVFERMGWKKQTLTGWFADSSELACMSRDAYVYQTSTVMKSNLMFVAQEYTEDGPNDVTVQVGSNNFVNYNERRTMVSVWAPLDEEMNVLAPTASADLIKGYSRVGYCQFDRVGNLLYLNTMIIEDDWQGNGFGKLIMVLIESIAAEAGSTKVVLHPSPHPLRSGPSSLVGWYKHLGYRAWMPHQRATKLSKDACAGAHNDAGIKPPVARVTKWVRGLLSKKVGSGANTKMSSTALVLIAGALDEGNKWTDANDDSGISVRLSGFGSPTPMLVEVKSAALYTASRATLSEVSHA